MAGASHNGPLLDTQGWVANTEEGMAASANVFNQDDVAAFLAEYAAYEAAYNAEHGI